MNRWTDMAAPTLDDFAQIAQAALTDLPEPFRGMAAEVRMQVADFAEEEMLEELGIDDPFELTGLYEGTDLAHLSVLGPAPLPSRVLLFRRPILDEWAERGNVALGELITHVLVHEIGHHFGLSDDDIHAAEKG